MPESAKVGVCRGLSSWCLLFLKRVDDAREEVESARGEKTGEE